MTRPSPLPFSAEELSRIRADFPILQRQLPSGSPLVYLDNAATSQKPQQVLDRIQHYYRENNANVHRGMHTLAEEATADYESARQALADFVDAPGPTSVVFTRGTTEAINLVAQSWALSELQPGDEIVISVMEHHSNIVPWQLAAQRCGAHVKAIPLTPSGELDLDSLPSLLTERCKLLAITQVSNALGTVNPVETLIQAAKDVGARVLIDAAQSAPHMPLSFRELGCDFLACSAHKMCGPTGIGALIASPELLETMPPWQGGGEMIDQVSIESSTYAELPYKFEAGTPNIAGAIAWKAALEYMQALGMDRIAASTHALSDHYAKQLEAVPEITLCAHPSIRGGAISFWFADVHPHDVAQILDQSGVAIRAGHVCCQPLMKHLGHPAINRASVHFYNSEAEVEALIQGLDIVRKLFL